MTILSTALLTLFVLNPVPPAPQSCTVQQIQGATLYCCPLENGLNCCSETLAEDGTVAGCGCTP
jgi:hypothetical protein